MPRRKPRGLVGLDAKRYHAETSLLYRARKPLQPVRSQTHIADQHIAMMRTEVLAHN